MFVMKFKSFSILLVFSFFVLTACSFKNIHSTELTGKKPKNIILFIGDGMGTAHVNVAMTLSFQPLALERFPYSGFCTT